MSGSIIDLSSAPVPATRTVDVCVIGSGCGGATAAWVLAEGGREVVVLEEGADRTGAQLTQRGGEMYDQLYMERGGRATEDQAISVMQARVLGGGGVINMSDVAPIPDGVLEHWVRSHGLTDFSPAAMASFRDRALRDLSANAIEEEQLNEANRALRQGTRTLGLRGEVMLHNRVGCAGLGSCLLGCPLNAKRNPRFVAIPAAMTAGATFYTRTRAVRIEDPEAELKTVVFETLDAGGHHRRGQGRLRARTVIVAANAIATPQLLLRSGIGNRHVGQNLILQPQLPIVAFFDRALRSFRGIPQAYAVTEYEREDHPDHGLWGFRVESIMGTPGLVAAMLPFIGPENPRTMQRYDHLAASLLLIPDAPTGSVELRKDGRPKILYTPRPDVEERLRQAVEAAVRIYLAAGAEEVVVPLARPVIFRSQADIAQARELTFAPATAPLISAHQQGTVRMAPSAEDGGARPDGLVWGTRGVYVVDSSLFPTSASTHTMTPILTISRYLTEQLLGELPPLG